MNRTLSLSTLALCLLMFAAGVRAQTQSDDPRAAALVTQAAQLETARKFDEARKKLDEAKGVNPRQASLWSNYGYLASVAGKLDEAVEDLDREIAEHPDEQNVYLLLVQVQVRQRKPEDAIRTLDKLIARSPANQQAIDMRAGLLLSDKHYPEAEKALRGILAAHPDSVQAQLLLATAAARQGKKADAFALLKTVIDKTTDPGVMNNAAYTLADEDLDAPLAEQTARRALAAIDQQSASTAFNPTPLLTAEVLVSLWDTLGWSLFHEGKAAQAEPWLRAAWINGLSTESGYHLGMALEKQTQPAKAMAVYELAKVGESGSDPISAADNIAAREQILRKAGPPVQVADARAALLALHTFKVPGANARSGSAVVQLELSSTSASNAMIVKDAPGESNLTPVESELYRIDYRAAIPPGTRSRLTRRGLLSCRAGTPCQFILFSTNFALAESKAGR